MFSSVKKNGLKLNRNKSQFNKTEVIFLGHKVTGTSIYPGDRKAEAIKNMLFPESKKELQRFLGTINYLGKFIPNLSENTENLRKLLEKNTEWYFDENHKKEIGKLKWLVISPPVLKVTSATKQ